MGVVLSGYSALLHYSTTRRRKSPSAVPI